MRLGFIAIAVCVWAGSAHAHPFAVSQIEATAEPDALRVSFNLDEISVDDLHGRSPAYRERRTALLAYLDERFHVANVGDSCPRTDGTAVRAADGRVHVSATYQCVAELSKLSLSSTLFLDEATPHRVIATVRHGRKLDRYLFGRSERTAAIDITRLGDGSPTFHSRQFRTAAPPPGAFSRPPAAQPVAEPPPTNPSDTIGTGFAAFVRLGVEHIFAGLDHILFVIVLVLAVRTFRELVTIVTTFTIAHSITLLLGGLGLITMSPALVEPLIAASIVYVAVENAVRREPRHRVAVVFGFGLMHGFGFAGALGALDLSAGETVPMLLGLNVGVELGQLAIVAPLFAAIALLRRRDRAYVVTRFAASAAASVVGMIWLVSRVA